MVSKTSYFNKTIFKKNFGRFWPLITAYALIVFVNLPLTLFFNCYNVKIADGPTGKELQSLLEQDFIYSVYNSISPVSILIAAVLAAMAVFAYLYNSRSANMIHALPVRREQLFITNYLSGLLFLFIPQLISFVLSIFVMLLCEQQVLITLVIWLLYSFGLSLFFYSFAVFCAMFTGNILALPAYYFILNFLYVGLRTLANTLVQLILYGISGDLITGLDWLSPGYFLTNMFSQFFYYDEATKNLAPIILLIYCGFGLLFTVCSMLLYRKRHLETAGDTISISFVKPIFRIGFTFCGSCVLSMLFIGLFGLYNNPQNTLVILIFSLLIFGFIAYFLAEMLLCKAYAVFSKKRFVEYGIYSIVLIALLLCVDGNLFGYETQIPKAENVVSANIYFESNVSATTKEHIASVVQLHQQLIDDKENVEASIKENPNTTRNFNIDYMLSDGTNLRRSYSIPYTAQSIANSDSHFNQILSFLNEPALLQLHYFGDTSKKITIHSGYISLHSDNYDTSAENMLFSDSDAKLLYEAVQLDVMEGNLGLFMLYDALPLNEIYENQITFEFATQSQSSIDLGETYYNEQLSLQLTTHATHTLQLLESLGLLKELDLKKLNSEDLYNLK